MAEWFTSLSTLEQVTLLYLIFLAVFAIYLYVEIKRSPIYLDDDMQERIEEAPPARTGATPVQQNAEG